MLDEFLDAEEALSRIDALADQAAAELGIADPAVADGLAKLQHLARWLRVRVARAAVA